MAVTVSADGNTKSYSIRGLTCDVHTSSQFVTVYRGDAPVATLQRARVYSGEPAWSVWVDGKKLADTGRCGVIVGLLHKVSDHLAEIAEAAEIVDAPAPAVIESRPNMWRELTNEEQREATDRGFPRGADVRYILNKAAKPHATPRQWQLVRWTRVRPEVPAKVETIAFAASDSNVHPLAEGSQAAALADAGCQAFDRVFRKGMKTQGLAVRDIRRAAMAAAIAAALALMPNGASASEDRAAWAATGAAQCGFPVTMADAVTGAAHIEPYASRYASLWARHDDESPSSFALACETLRAQVRRGEFAGFTYGAAPANRAPLASLRPGQLFCHYGAPVIARTAPQDNEGRAGYDFAMIEYTRADLAGELGVAVIRKGEALDMGASCGGKGF